YFHCCTWWIEADERNDRSESDILLRMGRPASLAGCYGWCLLHSPRLVKSGRRSQYCDYQSGPYHSLLHARSLQSETRMDLRGGGVLLAGDSIRVVDERLLHSRFPADTDHLVMERPKLPSLDKEGSFLALTSSARSSYSAPSWQALLSNRQTSVGD